MTLTDHIYHQKPVCPPDCSDCCRGQVIMLLPNEVAQFPKTDRRKRKIGPHNIQALRLTNHGDCIYLNNGRCIVYDERPRVCRTLVAGCWACNNIREAAGLPKVQQ